MADYNPAKRKLSISNFILFFGKKSNGILSLSSRTNFNHKNFKCLPGIFTDINLPKPISNIQNKKITFLFSGTLSNSTGINLALKCFSKLKEYNLIISGRGAEEHIGKYTSQYSNIIYLGYQSYAQYLSTLNTIDICLSFRNPHYEENKHNFPSKILEYFALKKPVISTIEYPEINNFKYYITDYTENSVIDTINKVVVSDFISNSSRNYKQIKESLSIKSWKKAIKQIENER
jgi:glycosyltransferase involved in cell wall biosynthesis